MERAASPGGAARLGLRDPSLERDAALARCAAGGRIPPSGALFRGLSDAAPCFWRTVARAATLGPTQLAGPYDHRTTGSPRPLNREGAAGLPAAAPGQVERGRGSPR